MKRSRFTEEQIIAVLRELHGSGTEPIDALPSGLLYCSVFLVSHSRVTGRRSLGSEVSDPV